MFLAVVHFLLLAKQQEPNAQQAQMELFGWLEPCQRLGLIGAQHTVTRFLSLLQIHRPLQLLHMLASHIARQHNLQFRVQFLKTLTHG